MTSYVTPKKNTEFIFYVGLQSQANTKILQANPTLASGDAKVSIDGGALANLATLPAVTPASSKMVKVTLSASEMNGDNITVIFSDAAGAEWCDLQVSIQTTANQVDEIATNISTLLTRLSAVRAGYLDNLSAGAVAIEASVQSVLSKMLKYFQVALRKDQAITTFNATEINEINDPLATGSYNNQTDALEALQAEHDTTQTAIAAITGGATAAEVWSYATRTLTQSAASVIAAVTGSNIAVYRGTTWSITLTGLGNINAYDTIYMSVKDDDKPEDDAILRVYNDASGLLWFNGAEAETATNGTITIDDADDGDITITVLEAETQNAPIGFFVYDIKGIDDNGNVDLLSSGGKFQVTADITRAITSP